MTRFISTAIAAGLCLWALGEAASSHEWRETVLFGIVFGFLVASLAQKMPR